MTTIAAQSETSVFPLPPPSVAKIDTGLNHHLVGLSTNLRKLQANGSGGISGTLSSDELSSLNSVLGELSDAIAGLKATLEGLIQTEAQGVFDANLTAAADELLEQGRGVLDTATTNAGRLAAVGSEMILRAFVESLRNRSAIVNEAIVRSDLALTVEAVNASLGLSNATVEEISQAYANGDVAEAQSLNTVATTIAGNSASVIALSESVNGIEARWGITVNAQGQVLGLVRLDGDASGSTFTVVANVFQVAQPGASGGTAVPVFVIGNRNGTPAIGVRADMVLDGTITANALSVSTLSAIAANLGTVTAGRLLSANGKVDFNLNAGTFEILA